MKSATSASVVLCVAVVALSIGACDVKVDEQGNLDLSLGQGRARDTWKRSYTIPKGGLLEISNPLGRIQAEPASGTEVEVVAEREVHANSDEAAQAGIKTVTMLESVTPDSVRIEAKVERPEGFSGRVGVSVRYSVRVPPGVRVSFKNEIGETIVTGLTSGVTIAATTGPVRGRDLSGPVDAATVNGPVELSFVAVNADVKAQTINGGVDVRLPADANAEIEARAVNGGVRVDDGLKLEPAVRERTSLRGTLNAGGPTVTMAVTNGGVFIGSRGAGTQPAERGPERRER
jgi:hypothetical protein